MTSVDKVRSELKSYVDSERIVRIRRHSRPSYTIDGFVLAVGNNWVLLSRAMEGGYFDGHAAIRIRDIKRLRRDTSFQPEFAKTQPGWPPSLPTIHENLDLDSTRGMLRSLLRKNHVIGIERDKRVDGIWIGVPNELRKRWLYIWEVDSYGRWHDEPLGYKVATITTVIFDDHYQTALRAVAGDPPLDASADWSPTQVATS
jgi:hypothetical protein